MTAIPAIGRIRAWHRSDRGLAASRSATVDRAGILAALAAAALLAAAHWTPLPLLLEHVGRGRGQSASGADPAARAAAENARETRIGGYVGVSHTYPSAVTISNPPTTEMTVTGFNWKGMPFKSPIYYGLRAQRAPAGAGVGTMLDFTHAKAIAVQEDVATFTGIRNGKPVPPTATIRDTFKHLEFSHGHNIVTGNGLYRFPALFGGLRPYIGLGAGITLPHTEVGFRDENARTYEYQFAGFAGQVLVGLEIPAGPAAAFLEWKLTYAPYSVPLSHEPYGWLLVTDLWRQFRAWMTNEKPPGGTLRTTLVSHHGIAGVMARVGRAPAPAR